MVELGRTPGSAGELTTRDDRGHSVDRRPLAGLRVLDLTNVLAGPYCTYQLVLLGADVVKIEMPVRGDLGRSLGADSTLNEALMGTSFLAQNAGKHSVELDLKSPEGNSMFARMVHDADVVVENFRPGVFARLGFTWERLHGLNPALIYCAISGFGQDGPMSHMPAYDQIIQGLSGVMSTTGTPQSGALRTGFPVCDSLGGLAAALTICGALLGRERSGQGTQIDVSMLEVAMSSMGWILSNHLTAGVDPQPMANDNSTAAPSGTFQAADGPLNVSANRQEQFVRLCQHLDRVDLLDDHRFASPASRLRHRESLTAELNLALAADTAANWEERLARAGVPAARVLSVADAVGLAQVRHRGFIADLPSPVEGRDRLRVVGSGVHFDGKPFHATSPPPGLGADTAAWFDKYGCEDGS